MMAVLITCFDIKDLVYFQFIPKGQTINQAYYVELTKRLREDVLEKRLNFGPNFAFSNTTMLQL
jgi:hypothetical protein